MKDDNKGKQQYTDKDKAKYYEKRINDETLSDGQRNFAAKRFASLTGKPSDGKAKAAKQTISNNGGNNYGGAQSFTVTVKTSNNYKGGK